MMKERTRRQYLKETVAVSIFTLAGCASDSENGNTTEGESGEGTPTGSASSGAITETSANSGGVTETGTTTGPLCKSAGCDAETATRYFEDYVTENSELSINVKVSDNTVSYDSLVAYHTTTGDISMVDTQSNQSDVLKNVTFVAGVYNGIIDAGFNVGDLQGKVVYSLDSGDVLATWHTTREWAERYWSGEWDQNRYDSAVLSTFEA